MNNLKYHIVKEDQDGTEIRFFIIGYIKDGLFTGMMHDYTGSGNYEEAMVYNNEFINQLDIDGEVKDWDKIIEEFSIKSGVKFEELEKKIFTLVDFDYDIDNYIIDCDSTANKTDNPFVYSNWLSYVPIPYGLGSTYFDGKELETIDNKGE